MNIANRNLYHLCMMLLRYGTRFWRPNEVRHHFIIAALAILRLLSSFSRKLHGSMTLHYSAWYVCLRLLFNRSKFRFLNLRLQAGLFIARPRKRFLFGASGCSSDSDRSLFMAWVALKRNVLLVKKLLANGLPRIGEALWGWRPPPPWPPWEWLQPIHLPNRFGQTYSPCKTVVNNVSVNIVGCDLEFTIVHHNCMACIVANLIQDIL